MKLGTLRRSHPLSTTLRTVVLSDARFVAERLAAHGVTRAALFGSVARRSRSRPRDIDVLVWGDDALNASDFDSLAECLATRWGYPVHISLWGEFSEADATSILAEAIPLDALEISQVSHYDRRMVAGYETEDERRRRLAREYKAQEAERRAAFARTKALASSAARAMASQGPNCMVELWGDRLFKKNTIIRRTPGWFLGLFPHGNDGYGGTIRTGVALGRDGKLYLGGGVGDRKEFRARGELFAGGLSTEGHSELLEKLRVPA